MAHGQTVAALAAIISLFACRSLPPSPAAQPPGVSLGWSMASCTSPAAGRDADADGLDDGCELALARGFAPVLVASVAACNWDPGVAPARLGGEYYFAVGRARAGGALRIAYLPAYYRDCGWSGPKCALPFTGCGGHDGDSEVIIVEVEQMAAAAEWRPVGVFLSSHCFSRLTGNCRWYRGAALAEFEWDQGAPVVWVAEGSNAGFPTRSACDASHLFLDTCDRNEARVAFPVRSAAQNIGSASAPARPGGCYPGGYSGWGSSLAASDLMECFWTATPFRGWQRDAATASTPYSRYLHDIAGF